MLLTNLQATTAGSKQRAVRLPSGDYSNITLDFTLGGTGGGTRTVALDVGGDGSIDWNYSGTPTLPITLTGDLAAAINATWPAKRARWTSRCASSWRQMRLSRWWTTAPASCRPPTWRPTASAWAMWSEFGNSLYAAPYTAGNIVPVQATLGNGGSRASGPVTAAFFAHAEGWGDWYIGSAFFADIAPGATVLGDVLWDTTGFSGTVPVKVVVNPYWRVAESNELNNAAVVTATVIVESVSTPTPTNTPTPTSTRRRRRRRRPRTQPRIRQQRRLRR